HSDLDAPDGYAHQTVHGYANTIYDELASRQAKIDKTITANNLGSLSELYPYTDEKRFRDHAKTSIAPLEILARVGQINPVGDGHKSLEENAFFHFHGKLFTSAAKSRKRQPSRLHRAHFSQRDGAFGAKGPRYPSAKKNLVVRVFPPPIGTMSERVSREEAKL